MGLGPEALTNGNMETGDPPSSWTAVNSTADGVADERTGGSGSQSMQVTATAATGYVKQEITSITNNLYQISYWYKCTAGDTAIVLVEDVSGGTDWYNSGDLTATSWTHIVSSFTALDTDMRVALIAKADTDVVRFDDVSIRAHVSGMVMDTEMEM